jgi:hypothetical protein
VHDDPRFVAQFKFKPYKHSEHSGGLGQRHRPIGAPYFESASRVSWEADLISADRLGLTGTNVHFGHPVRITRLVKAER